MKLAEQTKDAPEGGETALLSEEELRKAESSEKVATIPTTVET